MTELDFARSVLCLAERLVSNADVRVETARRFADQQAESEFLPDVIITHVPTGEVVRCGNHGTQIENKVEALLQLRVKLDERAR